MIKFFQSHPNSEPRDAGDGSPLSRIEAALFLSREPLPGRRLALLAGLKDVSQARELVRDLNRRYRAVKSAFCVVEVADGFQLRTHPQFASWLFRLQEVPVEVRLTRTAMETLAIVAYQQPILRAQIERIRGAACGDILRQLMDQNLIQMVGRLEEPGRPILYGTTKRFLQVFGLTDITALPSYGSGENAPSETPPPSGETSENEP